MWSALPTLRVPAWKPQAPVARSMSHPAPPPALAQCGGLGRPPAASRGWPCWSSRLQPLPQACQPAPRVPSPLLPCVLWPHPAQTQSWPRGGPGAGGARGPPLWVPGPGPDPSPLPKFPNSAVPRSPYAGRTVSQARRLPGNGGRVASDSQDLPDSSKREGSGHSKGGQGGSPWGREGPWDRRLGQDPRGEPGGGPGVGLCPRLWPRQCSPVPTPPGGRP